MPEILQRNKNILFVFNIIDSKRTKLLECKILQTTDMELHCKPGEQAPKIRDNGKIQLYKGFDQTQLRTVVAAADLVVAPSLSE
ncbi:MAG: hypothetical protein WCG98_01865 [bacterium]